MHDHDAKYGPGVDDYGRKKNLTAEGGLQLENTALRTRVEKAESENAALKKKLEAVKEEIKEVEALSGNVTATLYNAKLHEAWHRIRAILDKKASE